MSVALFNVTTADGYTDQATRHQPFTQRILVQVANAGVAYQLDESREGSGVWGDEAFLAVAIGSLGRRCSGIRFRSALAGSPAQVSATLLNEADLTEGGDFISAFGEHISASGGVGPGVGTVLAENTLAAPVTISSATEATPDDVIDAGSVTFDGATAIRVEAFCPQLNSAAWILRVNLWDMAGAGVNLGQLARADGTVGTYNGQALLHSEKFTPTSGPHQYRLRGFRSGGAGGNPSWGAGGGGAGQLMRSWIRVVVA